MVVGTEINFQADIIFAIESTAVNGAYINDLKSNYIIPTLEYFSQGNIEERDFMSENVSCLYGIVTYQAADCLPHPSSDTIGPFTSPTKLLNSLEKLELIGGKGESHANIAEGLATALQCFDELQQKRDTNNASIQKHCILICNSPPYMLPVMESHNFAGKTVEQLAATFLERNINFSVISPRKIPALFKLFEKAGGDLSASQTKNYAKDPRHLVLLKGYSLKERPISPPPSTGVPAHTNSSSMSNITSLPSPLSNNDSPMPVVSMQNMPNQNLMNQNQNPTSNTVAYRPNQNPHTPNIPGMVQPNRPMMQNTPFPNQPINAPPSYNRPPTRWMMPPQQQPPQQRPIMAQNNASQGSALIAQLTQPPSVMGGPGVNQFGVNSMGNNQQMNVNQQQQQQMQQRMNTMIQNQQPQQQQNVQTTTMSQNPQQQQQPIMQPTSCIPPSQPTTSNPVVTSQANNPQQPMQPIGGSRERHTIWQGVLEYLEKPKNIADQNTKLTRNVPCQVSANSKDGEPELKADSWPQKLIMQLMPKQLIGNIGGAYLKNSKSVLFHLQPCEALESLTKVMSSGFAGCVHFTSGPSASACDIKVLILLYTSEKRAYLGFIPNDQVAFVDRLRKVIQQQKTSQAMIRQGQGGTGGPGPSMNPGTPGQTINQQQQSQQPNIQNQTSANSQPPNQQQQQGIMISQTNTIAMGGGQITQNVVTSSSQQGQNIGGVLGQPSMNPQGPRMDLQRMPTPGPQGPNAGIRPSGMMGPQQQRPSYDHINFDHVARQKNLENILQLKQTLEAAQQQEAQYKSQLEMISHIKTSQLQEALNVAQQQEMQYKMMDQQRQMGNPQPGAATANPQMQQQQQRMMRPMMANNPGLKHLLQQQPQYRTQMMNMQQMGTPQSRPQMGQQIQNQQQPFDDVGNFDFLNQ